MNIKQQQIYTVSELTAISEAIHDLDTQVEELEKALQLGRFAKNNSPENENGEQQ